MEWKESIYMIFGAISLVGAAATAYQIYRLTLMDAKARGLKASKILGDICHEWE